MAEHPASLTPAKAAELLTKAGGKAITEEMIANDIEDGAPVNADGTINLVFYAAWTVKELANGGR